MSWRSLQGAQERSRDSEGRLVQEFSEIVQGASQSGMTPDPSTVCPTCHGDVPPRETHCPHCGHDFTALTPEVAEHVRRTSQAAADARAAGLRHWSRVAAMAALILLAIFHAPASVLASLGILVILLPGAASLAVIPLALTLLPWAYLQGPPVILAILTLAAWQAGAQFLHRPMLSAQPLAAAAIGCVAVALLGTSLYSLGWIEYPEWCARTRIQPSDVGVVQTALGMSLPDTVSIVRVESPGRPWPSHETDVPDPVLYDMQLDASGWHTLAAMVAAPSAITEEETTRTAVLMDDVLAFARETSGTAETVDNDPALTVCRREDNLLLTLDVASSPTLHLYLAVKPPNR